ncbi:hypothetical protein B0G38_000633 [Arthrobacter sp. VKM Ac-2550]|nr:hypothetical protein [Arthrobacter sp. VKM Ac-2550]
MSGGVHGEPTGDAPLVGHDLQDRGSVTSAAFGVLDPDGRNYVEVPYRCLSHPAVTLWEHRQVLSRLKQR